MTIVMNTRLEGRRFTLHRTGDDAMFAGWFVKAVGNKWMLELVGATPALNDRLTVVIYAAGRNAIGSGTVSLVSGQSVVFEPEGELKFVTANHEARVRVEGFSGVWKSPNGPVSVKVVDLSVNGFGFTCDKEIPQGVPLPFQFALSERLSTFMAVVVHLKEPEPGKFKGGARLKFESRLISKHWMTAFERAA